MVTITSLVPPDHLLQKIDAALDFSFIRERVSHLYCADNGRPALDPEVLFKTLLIVRVDGPPASGAIVGLSHTNIGSRPDGV